MQRDAPARQDKPPSLCGDTMNQDRIDPAGDPGGRRRAMMAGLAAIALWGLLATLSVAAGPIPPFQMVAMTFSVGALLGIVRARRRGFSWGDLARWPGPVWVLGIGGLFGAHALYFAALQLAPPAQANLVNYLWPVLIRPLSPPLAAA